MLLSMISQAGSMNPFDMVAIVLGKVIEWIYEILTLSNFIYKKVNLRYQILQFDCKSRYTKTLI